MGTSGFYANASFPLASYRRTDLFRASERTGATGVPWSWKPSDEPWQSNSSSALNRKCHADHQHDIGPAGETYDLRFIDAMVQHHKGALRMSEFVFDIGTPGVGALGKEVWNVQSQEIKAMGQWRKAWYPEAPIYPIAYIPCGDPNSMGGLTRMSSEQIAAMQMLDGTPSKKTRVNWFLENMLHHHGAALVMAHDALKKSTNPTIVRLSRNIIFAQRLEMLRIRQMLRFNGLDNPAYYQYDPLFSF